MNLSTGIGARQGKDELRETTGSRLDVVISWSGNCSAKRGWMGGVSKTPNILNFLLWETKGFGDIEVRGEGFEAWWRGGGR